MLDGILNNRFQWNACKEVYEASLKVLEEEKAAKEAAGPKKAPAAAAAATPAAGGSKTCTVS